METILFENDDIEDDNDFLCNNQSLVKSLSLIITSTAGAVAALGNNPGNDDNASTTEKSSSSTNMTTQKPMTENLTTTEAGISQQQLNDFELRNNFQMTGKPLEVLEKFNKRKELSAATKEDIVKIAGSGQSSSDIARVLDLNDRTVRRIINRHRETGTVQNVKRCGRPKKMTDHFDLKDYFNV